MALEVQSVQDEQATVQMPCTSLECSNTQKVGLLQSELDQQGPPTGGVLSHWQTLQLPDWQERSPVPPLEQLQNSVSPDWHSGVSQTQSLHAPPWQICPPALPLLQVQTWVAPS